ncbi:DUF1707 SHOCT-like domain-containing protein [Raineyella sp.]|uniref:DUF1707 domain-containing protein n=1 Tax=bioreactor metagenome TaxID=1076179 RepID=A0A645B5W2_9ZZZZ|nr:DUF1707 domain-containing protein [Raineyella sp.]MEA5153690.1 DUF1707 domain-containing protein [Raineyella sp.]
MTAGMPDNLRASDVDRARVTEVLDGAYADGRLTLDEHRDRIARALAAKTFADLTPLTVDLGGVDPSGVDPGGVGSGPGGAGALAASAVAPLPADLPGGPPTGQYVTRPAGVIVDPSTESPRDVVIAVFSGAERTGVHRVPRGTTAVALFGGAVLDLRQAVLEARTVTIDAYAVFGAVEVVVPEGVRVINQVFPIFGAASSKARCADPSAPTVIIRGLAAFGGVAVTLRRSDEH